MTDDDLFCQRQCVKCEVHRPNGGSWLAGAGAFEPALQEFMQAALAVCEASPLGRDIRCGFGTCAGVLHRNSEQQED